jgi:hypothetical protein
MDMNNINILDLLTLATAGQRQTGTVHKQSDTSIIIIIAIIVIVIVVIVIHNCPFHVFSVA